MILKGSQRGSGQNLAAHLMRMDDNDHVRIHELRGFVSDDLQGAFKEAEAVSIGTKCQQYLFSLSINPPEGETVSAEEFESTIDRIEERLGLTGQPRAIVLHEKNARLHAHCVWSRIDPETMTARHMSFFKTKLTNLSRELYLEHGWDMPRGLIDSAKRDPDNFTLAEWQQAKRLGADPRWIKQIIRDCWARSDGKPAFEKSLSEHALFLCKGDKRGFVVIDHIGEVHSLSRALDVKQKDLGPRLGDPASLSSVAEAKDRLSKRMVPAIQNHIKDSHITFQKQKAALDERRAAQVQRQRDERTVLAARHQLQFESETRKRAARLPTGLRGLWHRITGRYSQVRRQNEAEADQSTRRQNAERHTLVERQMRERRVLETQMKEARKQQAALLRNLRSDVGRFLTHSTKHAQSVERQRGLSSPLRLQR